MFALRNAWSNGQGVHEREKYRSWPSLDSRDSGADDWGKTLGKHAFFKMQHGGGASKSHL